MGMSLLNGVESILGGEVGRPDPRANRGSGMESRSLEELIGQLGDQDGRRRQRVREALVAIGEAALPSLVALPGSRPLPSMQSPRGFGMLPTTSCTTC